MTQSTKEGLLFANVIIAALTLMFIIEQRVANNETELRAKCELKQGVLTYTGSSGYRCVTSLKANQ